MIVALVFFLPCDLRPLLIAPSPPLYPRVAVEAANSSRRRLPASTARSLHRPSALNLNLFWMTQLDPDSALTADFGLTPRRRMLFLLLPRVSMLSGNHGSTHIPFEGLNPNRESALLRADPPPYPLCHGLNHPPLPCPPHLQTLALHPLHQPLLCAHHHDL